MASKARVVVFGGTGFVGSAIAREAVRRGLAVTSVTRGGAPPAHVASQEWSNEVQWKQGDALEPDSFKQHLEGAAAVITAVGCLPLPSLTHDEVVRANGETNVMPGKMAKEAGVPRLVMVGASIPSFVPGMSFGMNTSKGLFTAGYKVGKEQAEAYAKEFADPATGAGAVVGRCRLNPGLWVQMGVCDHHRALGIINRQHDRKLCHLNPRIPLSVMRGRRCSLNPGWRS